MAKSCRLSIGTIPVGRGKSTFGADSIKKLEAAAEGLEELCLPPRLRNSDEAKALVTIVDSHGPESKNPIISRLLEQHRTKNSKVAVKSAASTVFPGTALAADFIKYSNRIRLISYSRWVEKASNSQTLPTGSLGDASNEDSEASEEEVAQAGGFEQATLERMSPARKALLFKINRGFEVYVA